MLEQLASKVIGQSPAMEAIAPYLQIHQAGLSPEGRPAGIFLLLGPTGTGKTRTVEALAEVLHGSPRNVLRIDCGEYQMEHEVAKLIGAPPGYLGHRETHPVLTQQRLSGITSDRSALSLVLFDEIEKAAPSLWRLLLGVFDKAMLRLGDNTTVNFERSLIFLTSNLGARSMMNALRPGFGFSAAPDSEPRKMAGKLQQIGMNAVRRKFSPEFVNRLDACITYQPLGKAELAGILELLLEDLQDHIEHRLGLRAFHVDVDGPAREFLINTGTSVEFGARHLKRAIHNHLLQPLAAMVAASEVEPGGTVRVSFDSRHQRLRLATPVRRAA